MVPASRHWLSAGRGDFGMAAKLIAHSAADVLPMMGDDEYAAFKADISAHGLREPIVLHEGRIVDGRNRYRACRELNLEPTTTTWDAKGSLVSFIASMNVHRRHLTSSQKAIIAAEYEPMFAAEAKERQHAGKPANGTLANSLAKPSHSGRAAEQAAKATGTNRQYVTDAKSIKAKSPEIAAKIKSGELTIPQARKAVQNQERENAVESRAATAKSLGVVSDLSTLVAAGIQFGTIYADPPWAYGNTATRANVKGKYAKTMTVEEICAEPVAQLVGEKAHLHLWTTNGFLFDARRVLEAWGFEYKSCFVWVKPQMGIGNYWRVSHEFMLLGVKGGLTFLDRGQMSWLRADRTKHSQKPHEVRRIVEKTSPGPYLEMYGRHLLDGAWTVYGNEVEESGLF